MEAYEKITTRKQDEGKSSSEFNFFAEVSEDKIQFPCQIKLNEFCNFVIFRKNDHCTIDLILSLLSGAFRKFQNILELF